MTLSIFVHISVLAIVVCMEFVTCNPLLFAFKTTTKTSPPVQTNQPVNGQTQNIQTPNPLFDKLRKFRSAMMALVQKKIDELNIVTATLQSQMRPQQSQATTGSQLGTPGVMTAPAQGLTTAPTAPGQQLPGQPGLGGTINPQLQVMPPAPPISGQQPGAVVSLPVAPPQVSPGQQVADQQGAAGLANVPVQQPFQPPITTQPLTSG